jgi:uncharacterized protein YkwD
MAAVALACCVALGALAVCAGAPAAHASEAPAHASEAPARTALTRCANASLRPRRGNLKRIEQAMLCVVDHVRASYGLGAVTPNRELQAAASSQVASMIGQDYFSDDRPTGQTPTSIVAVTSYPGHTADVAVGQNIAWGTGADATPARVVAQWLASPAHREVMLASAYREAGVAVRPAVPAVLHAHGHGATYALELGARD